MNCKILFIVLLIISGTCPNLIPNLDDIKDSISEAGTAVKGALGTVPELFPDVWNTFFEVNNLQRVPFVPVPELIHNEGYPSESHYVNTQDGYILNIHRIPHGKSGQSNGKVVYLQHGLMASSADYVLFGPKHGLAYKLADLGYDVWMGNVRGNTYSRNHTTISPDDKAFWNFSWHEIGIYDIAATIDYILFKTGHSQLFHVGHSQGTTTFYVLMSEKPEYNQKVIAHVSLAPIAFMEHMFSPLVRLFALGSMPASVLLTMVGQEEFAPNAGFLNLLTDGVCSQGVGQVLCKNALFATCGFSPDQMAVSNLPLVLAYYPAGASTKQFLHYGQEVNSGRFNKYDYLLENFKKYGSLSPPDYHIAGITAPIHLIYGSNDWMASRVDVKKLADHLPNLKELYNVPIQTWNHLDFNFGNEAPTVIYDKVVQILFKY